MCFVVCHACHCSSDVPLFPRPARPGRHAAVLALTAFRSPVIQSIVVQSIIYHPQEQVRGRSPVPRRSSALIFGLPSTRRQFLLHSHRSCSRLTLPNTFRPMVSHYEEQVRLCSLCCVLPVDAHTPNLPRYIRRSSVIARSAYSPHFVDPDLFPVHHQPLGQASSAVYRCQSSRTHHRRASGPRWRDRQTCPHSRQIGGPIEVSVHRLPTAFGRG